jgi:hypothetical protein
MAGNISNPGQFKKGSRRASEAGKQGAETQPIEAKRRGGRNSHKND